MEVDPSQGASSTPTKSARKDKEKPVTHYRVTVRVCISFFVKSVVNSMCLFVLQDNGCGMKYEDIPNMFGIGMRVCA